MISREPEEKRLKWLLSVEILEFQHILICWDWAGKANTQKIFLGSAKLAFSEFRASIFLAYLPSRARGRPAISYHYPKFFSVKAAKFVNEEAKSAKVFLSVDPQNLAKFQGLNRKSHPSSRLCIHFSQTIRLSRSLVNLFCCHLMEKV